MVSNSGCLLTNVKNCLYLETRPLFTRQRHWQIQYPSLPLSVNSATKLSEKSYTDVGFTITDSKGNGTLGEISYAASYY